LRLSVPDISFTDDVLKLYEDVCVVLDVFPPHQPTAALSCDLRKCTLLLPSSTSSSSSSSSSLHIEHQRVLTTALVIAELLTGMSVSDIVSDPSPASCVWRHCSHDVFDVAAWVSQVLDSRCSSYVKTLAAFNDVFDKFVSKGTTSVSAAAIFQWERYDPDADKFEQLSTTDSNFLEFCFTTQPPTTTGVLPQAALVFNIEIPLCSSTGLGFVTDSSKSSAFALRRIFLPQFRMQPHDFWLWQRLIEGHSWTACTPGESAALEHARNFSASGSDGSSFCDNVDQNDTVRRITITAARLCPTQIPHSFAVVPYCVRASSVDVERITKRVHLSLPE
jgi:hypothetical protein